MDQQTTNPDQSRPPARALAKDQSQDIAFSELVTLFLVLAVTLIVATFWAKVVFELVEGCFHLNSESKPSLAWIYLLLAIGSTLFVFFVMKVMRLPIHFLKPQCPSSAI